MTLYRARHLVSMDGAPIENGGMLVDGDTITGVGLYKDLAARNSGSTVDLGDVILMPGLINAHCHLEFSSLRNSLSTPTSFTKWIQRINATKRGISEDDFLQATKNGASELLRHGTTSIVNIESFPELLLRRPALAQRVWWCYEMIDIRLRQHSEESILGALGFFETPTDELTHFGLSPHAPYTASAKLIQLAKDAAQLNNLLLTIHVGESAEEMQMFQDASGPLYEFLTSLDRDMNDCGLRSPLAHLISRCDIPVSTLLIHLNELAVSDYALLERWANGEKIHVVHCPKSGQFFQHTHFPYQKLLEVNANISLGTDSLASNDRLDLFSEMQCFASLHPEVAPLQILEMVTRNPALTLGLFDSLGVLRSGAKADAITIPTNHISAGEIYDTILNHSKSIQWVMIAGKVIVS